MVVRAMEGEPQLLMSIARREVDIMERMESRYETRSPYEGVSTRELLGQFVGDTIRLFKKEAELAKTEVKEAVRNQAAMITGFVTAAVLGLVGAGLVAAALVLGLAEVMAPWLAALIVGVVLLGVAALVAKSAKSKGFKNPFERTQRSVKEDLQWIRERTA